MKSINVRKVLDRIIPTNKRWRKCKNLSSIGASPKLNDTRTAFANANIRWFIRPSISPCKGLNDTLWFQSTCTCLRSDPVYRPSLFDPTKVSILWLSNMRLSGFRFESHHCTYRGRRKTRCGTGYVLNISNNSSCMKALMACVRRCSVERTRILWNPLRL